MQKSLRTKKRWRVSLLFILMVFGTARTYAQSTIGTDFWVTFMPNYDDNTEIKLIAAGKRSCSGTVSNPNTNWSKSFSVTPGVTTNITIPKAQAYDNVSDRVINKGLRIVSTDSISLYASNFMEYSFDVTDVLPTASLGNEYLIQTYPSGSKGIPAVSDGIDTEERDVSDCTEFSIVAVENNTNVTIVLSSNSLNGHYADQPFSITLNAGQCYQVLSVPGNDFSGSRITVANDKKVAVFAGNLCANVPNSYCCCDHIVEQMMPVSCWGKKFVVTNSKLRSSDVVRITSLKNNCKVWKNGSLMTTINANRTYQFTLQSSTPAIYLETSEPVQVYLYFTGSNYGGSDGDPSMVIINPIEQKINDVTFSTFNSGTSRYHYVNIATDADKVSTMKLDGNNIASQFQVVGGNPDYAYARVQVSHGSHTLSNSKGGFVAHVYGLGTDESYSYSVGSMAKNLTSQLLVNGEVVTEHPNGFDVCGNEPTVFNLNLNFDFSHAHWDFGDGQEGEGNPVSHVYDAPGDYVVSCDVYSEEDGVESLVSTLSTTMHIHEEYSVELFVTQCDSYQWFGQNYTQSGDYQHLVQSHYDCDSLLNLHLTIEHYEKQLQQNACDAYEWYGNNYNHSGVYEHTVHTAGGCDTLLVLNLTINPTETTHHTIVSCDKYQWGDTEYDESGVYEHYEGETINGCDSIAILDVTINKTPQIEILGYTQIAFSSNQWHGIYHYYVTDSTLLEPGSVIWSCSNSDWIFVPVSDFHIMVIAKSQGTAVLSVSTSMSSGCDTSATIELNATGFDVDDNEGLSVKLFPNPAQTEVTVTAPQLSHISLINALGQTVKELSAERVDSVAIPIGDVAQGVYVVEIETVFGKIAKQLVISR